VFINKLFPAYLESPGEFPDPKVVSTHQERVLTGWKNNKAESLALQVLEAFFLLFFKGKFGIQSRQPYLFEIKHNL
jgi:hypothetical protein